MTTTRTPINRPPRSRITKEAIALFRKIRSLEAGAGADEWEPRGTRRQLLDAKLALHQLLGRAPWDPDVTDCAGGRPPWLDQTVWQPARDLYVTLDRAANGR